MDVIGRGVIAGFLATLALSAVIDPMTTVARIGDLLPPIFAWILHFFVGSFIWGAAFALLQPCMRGPFWLRGLVFGAAAWLIVMIAVLPFTRAGWFGLDLGLATPAIMLLVHLAYGALVGSIFGALGPRQGEAHPHGGAPDESNNELHPLPR